MSLAYEREVKLHSEQAVFLLTHYAQIAPPHALTLGLIVGRPGRFGC